MATATLQLTRDSATARLNQLRAVLAGYSEVYDHIADVSEAHVGVLFPGADSLNSALHRRAVAFVAGMDEHALLRESPAFEETLLLVTRSHVHVVPAHPDHDGADVHATLCRGPAPPVSLLFHPRPAVASPASIMVDADAGADGAEVEDASVLEEWKASRFCAAVHAHTHVHIPVSLTGDRAADVERWPLVQTYALEGFGPGGFLTQRRRVHDAGANLLARVCVCVDAHTAQQLAHVARPAFAKHWTDFLRGFRSVDPYERWRMLEAIRAHGVGAPAFDVCVCAHAFSALASDARCKVAWKDGYDPSVDARSQPLCAIGAGGGCLTVRAVDVDTGLRCARTVTIVQGSDADDAALRLTALPEVAHTSRDAAGVTEATQLFEATLAALSSDASLIALLRDTRADSIAAHACSIVSQVLQCCASRSATTPLPCVWYCALVNAAGQTCASGELAAGAVSAGYHLVEPGSDGTFPLAPRYTVYIEVAVSNGAAVHVLHGDTIILAADAEGVLQLQLTPEHDFPSDEVWFTRSGRVKHAATYPETGRVLRDVTAVLGGGATTITLRDTELCLTDGTIVVRDAVTGTLQQFSVGDGADIQQAVLQTCESAEIAARAAPSGLDKDPPPSGLETGVSLLTISSPSLHMTLVLEQPDAHAHVLDVLSAWRSRGVSAPLATDDAANTRAASLAGAYHYVRLHNAADRCVHALLSRDLGSAPNQLKSEHSGRLHAVLIAGTPDSLASVIATSLVDAWSHKKQVDVRAHIADPAIVDVRNVAEIVVRAASSATRESKLAVALPPGMSSVAVQHALRAAGVSCHAIAVADSGTLCASTVAAQSLLQRVCAPGITALVHVPRADVKSSSSHGIDTAVRAWADFAGTRVFNITAAPAPKDAATSMPHVIEPALFTCMLPYAHANELWEPRDRPALAVAMAPELTAALLPPSEGAPWSDCHLIADCASSLFLVRGLVDVSRLLGHIQQLAASNRVWAVRAMLQAPGTAVNLLSAQLALSQTVDDCSVCNLLMAWGRTSGSTFRVVDEACASMEGIPPRLEVYSAGDAVGDASVLWRTIRLQPPPKHALLSSVQEIALDSRRRFLETHRLTWLPRNVYYTGRSYTNEYGHALAAHPCEDELLAAYVAVYNAVTAFVNTYTDSVVDVDAASPWPWPSDAACDELLRACGDRVAWDGDVHRDTATSERTASARRPLTKLELPTRVCAPWWVVQRSADAWRHAALDCLTDHAWH